MNFVMDSLVKPVVGLVYDSLLKHVLYVIQVGDNVEAMRRAADILTKKCQTVKIDIEAHERDTSKKCTPEVQGWLERAEGILEESQKTEADYAKRSCMLGTCFSLDCRSSHSISTRAVRVRQRAEEELKLIGEFKDFVQDVAPPPVQEMNISTPAGGQLEALLNKSLSFIRDGEHGILGIWGMGGVGKTTLLKLINNSLKTDKFVVVFVVASRGCTEKKLQGLIAEKLGISKEGDISQKILDFLKSKDFVLLLDDLWEPLNLEDVGIPHPLGTCDGHKRKVILTTRSLSLCGKMGACDSDSIINVECLKQDEAWALFRKNVGEGLLASKPQIVEVAQEVARECGGLPLALVTIGGAMALNDAVEVWEDALGKLRTSRMLEIPDMISQGGNKDPISLLKVSYDYLPTPRLKDCFLHCALWPEDYAIEKDELIRCWMGHGLLLDTFDNIGEVYGEGHTTINALLKACLLENVEEETQPYFYRYLKNSRVKMHDLTRDMALWVARDCGANKKKWLVCDRRLEEATEGTDKISIVADEVTVPIPTLGNLSNITTLIIRSHVHHCKDVGNIQYYSMLKYLDLTNCCLDIMAIELCRLEYLYLSCTWGLHSIPKEAKNLINLKYLYCRFDRIRSVPLGVLKSLEKLLVLDISSRWILEEDDDDDDDGGSEIINYLGDMMSMRSRLPLKALGINVHTALDFRTLARLSSISMIALSIQKMEDSSTIPLLSDDFLGRPHMHSDLKRLGFWHCKALERLVFDRERCCMGATETLVLYNLKVLKEIIWRGVQPWDVLPKLGRINICSCDGLEDISWVALLPCLEILELNNCRSLRCINVKKVLEPPLLAFTYFRSLRVLDLHRMPCLTSISEQEELVFPSLNFVLVRKCRRLTKLLPFGSGASAASYLPKLQKIIGEQDWWGRLELEYNFRSSLSPFFEALW